VREFTVRLLTNNKAPLSKEYLLRLTRFLVSGNVVESVSADKESSKIINSFLKTLLKRRKKLLLDEYVWDGIKEFEEKTCVEE